MEKEKLTLRQMQQGACGVLFRLDELCCQLKLKYILAYGTMLGAVRHQGVIPWDDDIDILMPRPDYEALRQYFEAHSRELEPYKWFDHQAEPRYPHMIARVSDQRYRLEFDNERDYGIGVFVDIYPMDGVGNDFDAAARQIHKAKRLASLCFLTGRKSFGRDNTRSALKMLIKFPAYCWAKLRGTDHYVKKLIPFSRLWKYEDSRYVACITWPGGRVNGQETDIFEKSLLEDTVAVPFEGRPLRIPRDYDRFLTKTYGDYMQPPPEGQRTTNHTYAGYRL